MIHDSDAMACLYMEPLRPNMMNTLPPSYFIIRTRAGTQHRWNVRTSDAVRLKYFT